jgi:transcriptional regulator with XRE-family HTH domain
MSTVHVKPHFLPLAKRLKACIQRSGMTRRELAAQVDVHQAALSHYTAGRSLPYGDVLERLAKALDLDAKLVAALEAVPHNAVATTRARAPGRVGPAQQAAALHAARGDHIQVLAPPPRHGTGNGHDTSGVFGMRVDEDGTMHLWLRTKLPFDKGSVLLRTLLDFGLVTGKEDTDGQMGNDAAVVERDR